MKQTDTAKFKLDNYKIVKFYYSNPTVGVEDVNITIDPSGKYVEADGAFTLYAKLCVFANDTTAENSFITADVVAYFSFREKPPFNDIPEYFYPNSIAIIFPYIRAFITTITAVANVKTLILPTLNLFGLADILKENTAHQ